MEKRKDNKYIAPAFVIHPGESLKERLEDDYITQTDLARRTGVKKEYIAQIIKGDKLISPAFAIKLEMVLGIPASFWNNLVINYKDAFARIQDEDDLQKEKKYLELYNYAELAKLELVQKATKYKDKIINLRKYLGVSSIEYYPLESSASYRKSGKYKASEYKLAAWIRKGELDAKRIDTSPFDLAKLKSIIPVIRKLTTEDPSVYSKKLIELLAETGVALTYFQHLQKTYANGVTKWLSPEKTLILLSIKGKYADIFWFSLFHELGHIIKKHSKKKVHISFDSKYIKREIDIEEDEADEFAKNTLIPKERYTTFVRERNFHPAAIKEFAKELGIHHGIVAGRLAKENFIHWSELTSLRQPLEWVK